MNNQKTKASKGDLFPLLVLILIFTFIVTSLLILSLVPEDISLQAYKSAVQTPPSRRGILSLFE